MTDEALLIRKRLAPSSTPQGPDAGPLPFVHGLPGPGTPLLPLAADLRARVLAALDVALGLPAAPSAPLPAALDQLMKPPGVKAKHLQATWARLMGRLRFVKKPPGAPMQLLAVHAAFRRRPARAAGKGVYMPVENWALLASLAWDDLAFRHAVAERVLAFLRERHLMHPGPAPAPRLSPETCWLLVAAGAGPARRRWWMLGPARTRARRAEAVHRLASLMALSASGWAGFWDQWVLLRLLGNIPDLPGRLKPELSQALASLPLAVGGQGANPLAHPDWTQQCPDWLPPASSPST